MNDEKKRLINQLLKMCSNVDFSMVEAEGIIKLLNVNEPFVDQYGFLITFLSQASEEGNVKMVELLLKKGADPNLICDGENVLWKLQYTIYPEDEFYFSIVADKSDADRLEIAQILLRNGANPNIVVDEESLFSYVYYAVFDDDDFGRQLEYRTRFFILLVAYGGKDEWCKLKISKSFDKNKINNYRLKGFSIVDENDNVVAKL